MRAMNSVLDAIGNTPLIRLRNASERTGCEIFGKAEFLNPGGSIKDRTALGLVRDAERRGTLKPGGVIVEGTAGNTGIGLAVIGNALGYRTVIVMPNTQSREKIATLQLYGADVRTIPAAPFKDKNHFVHTSRRLAEELDKTEPNGALWANQFENTANRDFHQATTGPEIWEQTDGKVDAFVFAPGTGGTICGVGRALKERKPEVLIALADTPGSALYDFYTHGELKLEGSSITEGIGSSRISKNQEEAPVDVAFKIDDQESLPLVFELLQRESLCVGGSSGVNVAAAIRLAHEMGPGHTIVTMLCDYGMRYQSKLFNPDFLRSKGLLVPDWLETPE